MKLKDILNQTINRRNNQISFNFKKREAKSKGIDIKDILNTEIKCDKIFE